MPVSHAVLWESLTLRLFRILTILTLAGAVALSAWLCLIATDNLGTFRTRTDLADLDGDGDLDVVLHNLREEAEFAAFGGATLWINRGHGHFVPLPRGDEVLNGFASAAGDVDGDGDGDLIVFSGWMLRLVLNQGGFQGGEAGDFSHGWSVYPPRREGEHGSLALGDLDSDGLVDAVIAGCCGRAFTTDPEADTPSFSWVWINDDAAHTAMAAPGWVVPPLDGLAVEGLALGDMDGDGDLDLFATVTAPRDGRNRDPSDRVLINDGSGTFVDSGQRLGQTASYAVALGDLDGDADLDAMVGGERGAVVWLNQGGVQAGEPGAFARSPNHVPGGRTSAVHLSDVDGDGDLDALVAQRRRATVWRNDGQAGFTRSQQRFTFSRKHGLAVGDFDGDGRPDIFAAAYDADYRMWHNQGNGLFAPWSVGPQLRAMPGGPSPGGDEP